MRRHKSYDKSSEKSMKNSTIKNMASTEKVMSGPYLKG